MTLTAVAAFEVCCSILQCVAVFMCGAVCYMYVACALHVCCRVLQCIAVCCRFLHELQCVAHEKALLRRLPLSLL